MQVTRWDMLPVASHCQCTARSGKEKLKRTGRDAGRVGSGKSGCRARTADCRARKKRKMPSRYRCMGRSDLVAGVDEQLRSDRSPEHIAGPIRLDYPENQIMRISGRPSPAEVFNLAITAALATCMHRGDHSMVLPVSASIVLASGGTAASALSLSLAGLPSSSCNMRWALGARSDSG